MLFNLLLMFVVLNFNFYAIIYIIDLLTTWLSDSCYFVDMCDHLLTGYVSWRFCHRSYLIFLTFVIISTIYLTVVIFTDTSAIITYPFFRIHKYSPLLLFSPYQNSSVSENGDNFKEANH